MQARGGEHPPLLRDVQADRVDRRDGGNGQIWFLQAAGVAVLLSLAEDPTYRHDPCSYPIPDRGEGK